MPKTAYFDKNFHQKTLDLIEVCDGIIRDYQRQGFDLTVRQLHYQLVSRDHYENTQSNYNRLGRVISDARMAGLIDWEAIVDRTRQVHSRNHWGSPEQIISASASQYYLSHWDAQENYVEVWIEKDALTGVIRGVCRDLDVPYFSCRGYSSQSAMWRAAQRIMEQHRQGRTPFVIHLSDHDPSGIDMTRDVGDRLTEFGTTVEVIRLALTMGQINQYDPPPNFAKTKDPRFDGYYDKHGENSWELDALEPRVITQLIRTEVECLIDWDAWDQVEDQQAQARKLLRNVADNWADVKAFLQG